MDTPDSLAQPDSEPQNALQANIKKNGPMSYYYAHAPRNEHEEEKDGITFEAPGIITGGSPVMLATKESSAVKEEAPAVTFLTKYAWLDEKKKVKIYIDLTDKLFKGEEFKES